MVDTIPDRTLYMYWWHYMYTY